MLTTLQRRLGTTASEGAAFRWPPKVALFRVLVTPTNGAEATEAILRAARLGLPGLVACQPAQGVVEASRDAALRQKSNAFDMITPDGQSVRWALNLLHRTALRERVSGPELMLRLCCRAAAEQIPIYLYGSSPAVLAALTANLQQQFPGLRIAGAESPPFRPLSPGEDAAVIRRINQSGARIVFLGLGFPKQDLFAYEHAGQIRAVQVCVGAAFDFHAGSTRRAPAWMQRCGLEWLFRLGCEPRRLWRRYLVTNTLFLVKLSAALLRQGLAPFG